MKFIHEKDILKEFSYLKVADDKTYKVQKAEIRIESVYYSGTTEALCFDTDFDLIIGNIPGATCFCQHEEPTEMLFAISNEVEPLRNIINKGSEQFKIDHSLQVCAKNSSKYKLNNGILYKIDNSKKEVLCVPKKYTLEILELAHDSLSGAHMGINQTKAKISNIFYWPGMDDDVKQYVLSCEICQK